MMDGMMYRDVLMTLNGAKYCLTHDVAEGTKEFTVSQLNEMILKLERRQHDRDTEVT